MAEVPRVKHIVFERIEVISQGSNVMRSDKPFFAILVVLARQVILDVLQVVVRWQVELVTGRDHVIQKLRVVFLDHTKALVRVELLARLDIDEVLLDVGLLSLQRFLLLQLLLKLLILAFDLRLMPSELGKRHLTHLVNVQIAVACQVLILRQVLVHRFDGLSAFTALLTNALNIRAACFSKLHLAPIAFSGRPLPTKAALSIPGQGSCLLRCIG